MYNNYDYPIGADTPDAPWNQSDPETVSQDIEYSCTMRRTATVETTNYVKGTWEEDEYGFVYRYGDDFHDTDWLSEFKDTYRTPKELIDLLKETAKELADGKMPNKPKSFWKDVMADCKNWSIYDEETEML